MSISPLTLTTRQASAEVGVESIVTLNPGSATSSSLALVGPTRIRRYPGDVGVAILASTPGHGGFVPNRGEPLSEAIGVFPANRGLIDPDPHPRLDISAAG